MKAELSEVCMTEEKIVEEENNVTDAICRVTKYRLSRFWDPWPDWREKLYLGYNDRNHLDCVIEEDKALLMDSEADAISWQKFVRESEKWFIEEVEEELPHQQVEEKVEIEQKEDSNVLFVQEETEETKVGEETNSDK